MSRLEGGQNAVECWAGTEGGVSFVVVGLVIPSDVDFLALDREEFSDDFWFVGAEGGGDWFEGAREFEVGALSG